MLLEVSIENDPCQRLVNTTAMQSKKLARNTTYAGNKPGMFMKANAAFSKLMYRLYNQTGCLPSGPVLFSMRLAVRSSDAGFLDFVKHCSVPF